MTSLGKTACQSCEKIIYAWEDDCPHCGTHQDKEHLSIADRIRRAGTTIPEDVLMSPVEGNGPEWGYKDVVEAFHTAGIITTDDLFSKSVIELKQMFPDETFFGKIMRWLPCIDTRPITDEEREWKTCLFGKVDS